MHPKSDLALLLLLGIIKNLLLAYKL